MKFSERRAGIRDVAGHLGLSISTVSRALNGYSDVNSTTRKKVEKAAEELGYRASFAASTLRSQQTQTVTFMVSKPWTKFVDPFFLGLLDGLEMVLQAKGFDLQIIMAREFEQEINLIRSTVERRRCDALLFGRTRPNDERIDFLQDVKFPFVTIGQTLRNDHDWIDRDHFTIGRRATERLISFGHTRIAYLSTPYRYTYSLRARDGYRSALSDAGIILNEELEVECFLSHSTGDDAMSYLLSNGQNPTAIFCGNDMIALSAIEAMRRFGLEPGRDIAVIGCDDMPISAALQPELTTFGQNLDALGTQMGQMIMQKLGGNNRKLQTLIEAQLIPRNSDSPPRRIT